MARIKAYLGTVFLIYSFVYVGCVELQFELSENSKECFYQYIDKNVSSTLEFQVRIVIVFANF